ncbi:MAG TPA: chemotaxis protein CheX [Opitutaceae bacterium]|nr:chemotaxis protein CheX [Opitutaceae bacterium]
MPPVVEVPQAAPGATAAPSNGNGHGTINVVGNVGFTGKANGLVYIHLPLPFAQLCTCTLLGMTAKELDTAGDEPVNDAVGEFTNMIAGNFKNGFCDVGYPCTLTMPSILRSTDLSIQSVSSSIRRRHAFECAGHRIIADIHLKMEE